MPTRKLRKTNPETLAAFQAAARQSRELTLEEAREHLALVERAAIKRTESDVVIKVRRGKEIFRLAGHAGADMAEHPTTIAQKKQERALLTQIAKQRRPAIALQARQQRSAVLQAQVLGLLKQYASLGPGAAKAVAAELQISPEYVRRLRKRQKQT